MLDFSWSELALIGVVALVVIGPKDLPKALRTAGVWVRKARTISREFQSSVEQMMREAELDEVKKQIESVSSINIANEIEKAVDPTGDLAEALKPPMLPDFNAPDVSASVPGEPDPNPIVGDIVPPAAVTPPEAAAESPPAPLPETVEIAAAPPDVISVAVDTPPPSRTGTP